VIAKFAVIVVPSALTLVMVAVTPVPLTFTAVAPFRPLPVSVTAVVPPRGPEVGAIELRAGVVTVNVTLLLVPLGVVT
jgi:hypothetical protein